MAIVSRGFEGRRRAGRGAGLLPPGQYDVGEVFPVLSAGPTPRTALVDWDFRVVGEVEETRRWTWEEFQALPREEVTADIHCVTKWSKFDTVWEGVSVDTLLDGVDTAAEYVVAFCDGGYTTNLPLEDVTGGKAWVAHRLPQAHQVHPRGPRRAFLIRSAGVSQSVEEEIHAVQRGDLVPQRSDDVTWFGLEHPGLLKLQRASGVQSRGGHDEFTPPIGPEDPRSQRQPGQQVYLGLFGDHRASQCGEFAHQAIDLHLTRRLVLGLGRQVGSDDDLGCSVQPDDLEHGNLCLNGVPNDVFGYPGRRVSVLFYDHHHHVRPFSPGCAASREHRRRVQGQHDHCCFQHREAVPHHHRPHL
jgi:hypothetical protein